MSALTDAEDAASARQDILEDGQLITWYQLPDNPGPVAGNPWEDKDDAASFATAYTNTPIIFFPMNRVDFESLRSYKTLDVSKRIEQAYIPGDVPFVPTLKDYCITAGGIRYAVVNYDLIAPSGVPVLYMMQLQEQ